MNNRSNYALSRRFFSTRHNLPAGLSAPRVVCVAVLAALGTATADDSPADRDFVRRAYIGLGVGGTDLDPESRTPSLTVGEDRDVGGRIFLGYDFTPRFTIEGYYSDLGAAGIDFLGDEVGSVDYEVYGVSLLGYIGNSRDGDDYADYCVECDDEGLYRREGLSPFLLLGVGGMRNDSELAYDRDHTAHLTLGAGLEYGWSNGLAMRAEIISYDTDAHYAGLSLLKRFGNSTDGNRSRAADPKLAVPAVAAITPKLPARSTGEIELAAAPVDFPVPTFPFGKFGVTPEAGAKLDVLAAQMKLDESLDILVSGHTDSIGSDEFNQQLSVKRAASVKAYLINHGIDADRMRILGFGEKQPVESNTTDEGRAANRRVQISRI